MTSSLAWRRTISDVVNWRQTEALGSTIYILRETGPTAFLLKEEGQGKDVRVFIGDPHTCSCATFVKDRDLCKHICWVLLKKFRLDRYQPLSWQPRLTDSQINDLLRSVVKPSRAAPILDPGGHQGGEEGGGEGAEGGEVAQREVGVEDVCPICQDEFLSSHQPVTFCRYGCGNNVHIKCMKVYAEHQVKGPEGGGGGKIECPLCRADFSSLSALRAEHRTVQSEAARGGAARGGAARGGATRTSLHPGIVCAGCGCGPIIGKCYRCQVCIGVLYCQACFISSSHTPQHGFVYRSREGERWREVSVPVGTAAPLSEDVVNDLMSRDLTEADYGLLSQLDEEGPCAPGAPSDLTEASLRFLPLERLRRRHPLLLPGQQCCVCLRPYAPGQEVRTLPCAHRFHRACIDQWLVHRSPACPLDGTVYTRARLRAVRDAQLANSKQKTSVSDGSVHLKQSNIASRYQSVPSIPSSQHNRLINLDLDIHVFAPALRSPPELDLSAEPHPTTPEPIAQPQSVNLNKSKMKWAVESRTEVNKAKKLLNVSPSVSSPLKGLVENPPMSPHSWIMVTAAGGREGSSGAFSDAPHGGGYRFLLSEPHGEGDIPRENSLGGDSNLSGQSGWNQHSGTFRLNRLSLNSIDGQVATVDTISPSIPQVCVHGSGGGAAEIRPGGVIHPPKGGLNLPPPRDVVSPMGQYTLPVREPNIPLARRLSLPPPRGLNLPPAGMYTAMGNPRFGVGSVAGQAAGVRRPGVRRFAAAAPGEVRGAAGRLEDLMSLYETGLTVTGLSSSKGRRLNRE